MKNNIDQDSFQNLDSQAMSWDGVKQQQMRDVLKSTYAQRLAWLEDALKLAWSVKKNKA